MLDIRFCNTLQDSRNRIGVQYHGCYGTPPFCRPILKMFVMGALHHEDSSLRGDEFQKQERIPWRNVDYSGRKSHYDGTEFVKPPISAEFNDFGKNELFMFGASIRNTNSREINKSIAMSRTEIDTSMCNVRTCDENNETNGLYRKSRPMVVDTIIKPNRNSVAISLGHELQGQDQDDDIDYVKEVLVCYIEVRDYGFEHIIVIGERALHWTSFYGPLRPLV